MKALVIAPQPFFSPRGTPFSVYYRTLIAAQAGVQMDLLTYGQGQDVDIPGVRLIRIPRFGWLGPVKIGPSLLKAFLDLFMVLWTIGLLMRNRYDFVHAHEESVFWCRFLKPLFGFRLIYDMHSSLPQQLTNFKFTTARWLIGLFDRLERSALRQSDAVITICPDLRDYVAGLGFPSERHFLIENSIFDDVQLKGKETENGAGPSGDPKGTGNGRTRIVYAGTFETYQGIDLLIEAFAKVSQHHSDVELWLVGGTRRQVQEKQALADRYRLGERCQFTGQVSKSEAAAYLRSADILVSPRIEGTNTPLKIYEQLASGKPLVATNIWSHTQVLTGEVCFLVDPNAESMAEGLLAALNDEPRARAVAQAAQDLYMRDYSRAAYEGKIRQLFNLMQPCVESQVLSPSQS